MSLDKGAVYLLIFMFLFFVNTNAKIKVCFPKVCYSHNNPFAGKLMGSHNCPFAGMRMGRHINCIC